MRSRITRVNLKIPWRPIGSISYSTGYFFHKIHWMYCVPVENEVSVKLCISNTNKNFFVWVEGRGFHFPAILRSLCPVIRSDQSALILHCSDLFNCSFQENVRLRFKISYNLNGVTVTDSSSVDQIPVRWSSISATCKIRPDSPNLVMSVNFM